LAGKSVSDMTYLVSSGTLNSNSVSWRFVSRQLSSSETMLEELRQRVKVMDDALKGNAMSTNALENSKKNLEAKVKMYEDKLPHLENSLVSWKSRYLSIA